VLKINNIEVVYLNSILVLRGVSLEVPDGAIIALLGANGAGKTTTLKAVSGLLVTEEGNVTDGNIEFNGERIDKNRPEQTARLGIIQVMEGRRMFRHLTVEQNLMVGTALRSDSDGIKKDLAMVYDYFPKLQKLRRSITGYLSGGEQQMVVLGRAIMANLRLMLLDEPSLGLAPLMVEEIFSIIQKFNSEQKVSILLVEQNALAALSLAEYGYVMENGRIVLDGPSGKLMDNEDVREFYFGLTEVGQKKSYREVKHYKRRKRWLA